MKRPSSSDSILYSRTSPLAAVNGSKTYLFKKLGGIKSDTVHFCLIQVKTMEIEQVTH